MFSAILLACLSTISVHCQNQYGNIYGYDTSNTGNSNNGVFLVQNPNYQFLNDQLANEYSQTYLEELRNYDQQSGTSNNGGIVTSSSSVPANGYYTGPALSNQQQNQVNYQQIVQRNPSAYSNTGSSSNIYGYNYNSGTTRTSTGTNNYNNNVQYSAPSTAQPYVYPFGQFAPSGSSSSNPVLRDQSSNTFSSTVSPMTSTSTNNIGTGNVLTGRTYTLFDQPQNSQVGYTSASDLKTTRLRDQPPPATLNLRGTGPLPGPTLTSSNANSQLFRDAGSNDIYYGNANRNGQATYRFKRASRFFDVAGNNTEMYYPYRTSTQWQTGSYGTPSGTSVGSSGVQFDQSSFATSTMSPTGR
uniref:Mucin-like domain-containing protein n=1 Tax=Caenorhabditis tropicalis TaxID=1561998 RepID=A0A1I7TZJ9_9PELO